MRKKKPQSLLKRCVSAVWAFIICPWVNIKENLMKGLPYFKKGFELSYKMFKYMFIVLAVPTVLAVSIYTYSKVSERGDSDRIFEQNKSKVVFLHDGQKAAGTGFYVKAPSGGVYILTNKHVCEGSKNGNMYLIKKEYKRSIPHKIIEQYVHHDLCLVESYKKDNFVELADSYSTGQTVYTIGFPKVPLLNFSDGRVKGTVNTNHGPAIMASIYVMPGASGSPLLDADGKLLGVVFLYEKESKWGFAVPLDEIKRFLAPY